MTVVLRPKWAYEQHDKLVMFGHASVGVDHGTLSDSGHCVERQATKVGHEIIIIQHDGNADSDSPNDVDDDDDDDKVINLLMLDASALSGDVDEPVKKQHDAPEYLERRRGRRRSNGFIHGINLSLFYHLVSLKLLNFI